MVVLGVALTEVDRTTCTGVCRVLVDGCEGVCREGLAKPVFDILTCSSVFSFHLLCVLI